MRSSTEDRFDFSNPFISAAIVSSDGVRYPMWSGVKQDALSVAKFKYTRALAFVQEISVEIQLAYLPLIKVTLAPPYRDAIDFLDSRLMEWAGGSILEVQFGYLSSTTRNAVLSQVFSGAILKPEVQLGIDCTITLSAQGIAGFSASRQEGRRTFRDKTRWEIIKTIAEGRIQTGTIAYKWGGYGSSGFVVNDGTNSYTIQTAKDIDAIEGIPPDAKDPIRNGIRSDFSEYQKNLAASKKARGRKKKAEAAAKAKAASGSYDVPGEFGPPQRKITFDADQVTEGKDSASYQLLKKKVITYSQGGKTDWQAVYELVREAQCLSYWEGGKLKIVPRNLSFSSAEPKRVFRLFDYPSGAIGPAAGVFPILSASSPAMWLYMAGGTVASVMSDCNSETREAETEIVGDKETQPGRSTKGGTALAPSDFMPPVDSGTGTNAHTLPGSPSIDRCMDQAKAEYAAMTEQAGIPLTIETLADPRLFPGDAVLVRGLGQRFDVRYVVFKQTYTLGSGGANMSVELRSNAAVIDKTLDPAGPTPNKTLEERLSLENFVDSKTGKINIEAVDEFVPRR